MQKQDVFPKKKRAPGAGIKALDGVSKGARKQVIVDAESQRILVKIGAGNLSLGLREAARRLSATNNTSPYTITTDEDATA